MINFTTKLIASITKRNSCVCIGLDSRYDRLPEFVNGSSLTKGVVTFNTSIIDSTADIASAYKMNVSFYAGFGQEGLEGLRRTNRYLEEHHPDIARLADCKRSEMGESVGMVKREIFDWLGFDCIMVTPWFGFDTVRDYLADETKGVCVYVHDSNPTATEFQDLELTDGRRVYEAVAARVRDVWNTNGNVFVEAGATYPEQLRRVREIVGEEMVILTAGIGSQGGTIDAHRGVFGKDGQRLLVSSSRGIIFAGEGKQDYFGGVRQAAIKLRSQLRGISKSV